MNKRNKGYKAENLAAKYLADNGYEILAQNWYDNHKEIDIVARKDNRLIVVEVKMRKTDYFGKPYEFVSVQKQKFLIEAANAFLEKHDLDIEVQFDIISIICKKEINTKNCEIIHLPDAFGA